MAGNGYCDRFKNFFGKKDPTELYIFKNEFYGMCVVFEQKCNYTTYRKIRERNTITENLKKNTLISK